MDLVFELKALFDFVIKANPQEEFIRQTKDQEREDERVNAVISEGVPV